MQIQAFSVVCALTAALFLGTPRAMAKTAEPGVSKTSMASLKEIVGRYQKSPMVEMNLEKKVISEIMGRERSQKANAFVAPKRFRLETEAPDKTLIVYDGSVLWNVQYPQDGASTSIQVAKTKLSKKNQNQVLLGDLLVEPGLTDKFEFLSEKKEGSRIELAAKSRKQELAVADLKFVIDTKSKQIAAIEFSDELGNKTVMNFLDTKFHKKRDANKFSYKPEKGAQVTEL